MKLKSDSMLYLYYHAATSQGASINYPLLAFVLILGLLDASLADPRAQIIKLKCGNQLQHNTTCFIPTFVGMMEDISDQMRAKSFGLAVTGSGLDMIYALAECYGDLSVLDCMLCYARERTVVPQCFPYNGGRIYLDGCFMRVENYNFFQEYTGSLDRSICGKETRKDMVFQGTARRAVLKAALDAPNNGGYSRSELQVSGRANESVYVLADCWKTLSANSCRHCLVNASASLFGCFPFSEGRALNTGCFMRYSDINFLNPIPNTGSSRESILIIVAVPLGSVILLIAGGAIGLHFLNKRRIQNKRKGSIELQSGFSSRAKELFHIT